MGIEIERKYLIKSERWMHRSSESILIIQGYLSIDPKRTVRVRIIGTTGLITIKGKTQNITRKEFEYEIPVKDAVDMLDICEQPLIEKIRHTIYDDNNKWQVDVFEGENKGLVVAEIELENEDQIIKKPDWL